MIKKISHIGIAVNSIEDALKLYTDALGLKVEDIEIVEAQKVRTAIIPVGESKIELLESTNPEGVIAKYIEKRGEGLHHLALEVSDIQQALDTLREKKIQLIDETPRSGVKGARIAFLHPKKTKVLIELVEPRE
ncbi:MAG: methylmalonyl-CoA epimerase [Dehalococcoidia bacterium]|nr:MAG: methylmalonyl-CoA epimerase [Dehalococcoidia bacterium]